MYTPENYDESIPIVGKPDNLLEHGISACQSNVYAKPTIIEKL